MVLDFVRQFGAWTWVIAGIVLLGLEIVVPGVFLMWLGIAAIAAGILGLLLALSWQVQLIAFLVLACASVLLGRRYFAQSADALPPTGLNQPGERLIGTTAFLDDPIAKGHGRVRIDDTTWRVTGPDLPPGTKVRITGADGGLLTVEEADG